MSERDNGCTGGYGRCLMQIYNIYPFQRIDDSNWFLALVLMQFQIKMDLGLALAKGVAVSLIIVFLFMPSLVLSAYKFLDKTKHRPLMPSFRKFGAAVTCIAVCLFAIIVIPAYLGSNANEYYYGSSKIFNEETQLGRILNLSKKYSDSVTLMYCLYPVVILPQKQLFRMNSMNFLRSQVLYPMLI